MGIQEKEYNRSDKDERPARIARIFHLLGTDPQKNIDLILDQTLSIMEGFFSLYIGWDTQQEKSVIRAGSNLPWDLENNFFQGAPLFKKRVFSGHEKKYASACIFYRKTLGSDPLAKKYGLKACMGTPVYHKEKSMGTLWVTDTHARSFTPEDIGCIQTLSAALGLEEERLAHKKLLKDTSGITELEEKLNQAEKMELLGVIAGGVAHDLNNILSGLVSYPELLLMQLDKHSPLVEPISFIHDTGLKAAEIVQDLLTLTRRGVHQTSVLNLNQVVHDYFNSSAHHRLEKNFPGVCFKITSEPNLLNIKGSESHISKVVMNLVMNAVEAVLAQGRVSIEIVNRYVENGVPGHDKIREGEYVILRVSDDGDGIKKADIDRIFEPFYTKKQMGRSGTGLGLSVVWNAVKDHHGHIDVSSKKEEGTVFELYFPATREKMQTIPNDFLIAAFKGNNETILVIDDVNEQRKIAQGCIKILGYTPFAAESGEKAILFLKEHPVDLLVLEMKMEPGMDGLETYKRILEINPKQKAIIASGFSETPRVKEALKLGAGQYIKKPYTLQKFAIVLKKELEGTK